MKDTNQTLNKLSVVYSIHCSCGQNYIGETKRKLEARLIDYQTATRRGETNKSAIAEHTWEEQHQRIWNSIKVIDHARNASTLLIKEALHIINRNQGIAVADCWRPLFRRHFVN